VFQSVILAGGFGTRLKSISGDIPKPMVLVGGEPFLYMLMRRLEEQGCEHIVLSLYYCSEYIIKKIEHDKPVSCRVSFCVEETPLGTGGAIKKSSTLISTDSFVALNGDTLCDIDYSELLTAALDVDLIVAAAGVSDVSRYGRIVIDKDKNIIELNEKGYTGPGLINAGTYVVNTKYLQKFTKTSFSFEHDFLPHFKGRMKALLVHGEFVDIGVPLDYNYACKKFS
jgi:D-glycero-alpha-D-manno-heptose 1-phosphate guanylyltransferase